MILFIKRHIAVHHTGKADRRKIVYRHAVLFLHIFHKALIAVLHPRPYRIQRISPDAVHKPVLPVMAAGCDGLVLFIHQHRFDPCGAKLNPQYRLSAFNQFFCIAHNVNPPFQLRNSLLGTHDPKAASCQTKHFPENHFIHYTDCCRY